MEKESEKFEIKRKLILMVLTCLTLILSILTISAMGVANSYWDEKPLKLAPGESITISLFTALKVTL